MGDDKTRIPLAAMPPESLHAVLQLLNILLLDVSCLALHKPQSLSIDESIVKLAARRLFGVVISSRVIHLHSNTQIMDQPSLFEITQ